MKTFEDCQFDWDKIKWVPNDWGSLEKDVIDTDSNPGYKEDDKKR